MIHHLRGAFNASATNAPWFLAAGRDPQGAPKPCTMTPHSSVKAKKQEVVLSPESLGRQPGSQYSISLDHCGVQSL